MRRFRTSLITIVLIALNVVALALAFTQPPFRHSSPGQKQSSEIKPIDASPVQLFGGEMFQQYMEDIMNSEDPEYPGILSYEISQAQTAMRVGRPDIFVFSVTADATTQGSTIPITWGALINLDVYGNCTLVEAGPNIDDTYLQLD